MSLDSLFEAILQAELQLTEQTQKIKEAQVEINQYNEEIKNESEDLKRTMKELDEKAQQLSTMTLQCEMMRKCEEQMLKQIEEGLCQQSHLRDHLAKIKEKSKEEEKKFLQEITKFNNDFSLTGNGGAVLEGQTRTEVLALQKELEVLHEEMEAMKRSNIHMSSIMQEMRKLLLEVQDLDDKQKDLDRGLKEGQAMGESLRVEIQYARNRHLTDSSCLSLRKELELLMQKNEELEQLRRSLSSEVQFLQSSLKSSQK